MIQIVRNFVDRYEAMALIYELDRLRTEGRMRRDDNLRQEADLIMLPAGQTIMRRIELAVTAAWPETKPAPEYAIISRMFTGDCHPLHADNRTLDDKPNGTAYRTHTALLYLSEHSADFDGGEISFPAFGTVIYPKVGLLILSLADLLYRHEVKPIIWGSRVCVAYWFKRRKEV